MYSESELTWEEALNIADEAVFNNTGNHLTDAEITVLQGSWDNLIYQQIASRCNNRYTPDYLRGDVGSKLWQKLSDALGEPVRKGNFRGALNRQRQRQHCTCNNQPQSPSGTNSSYWCPEGPVALDDSLYVTRSLELYGQRSTESECYQTIVQPGSLIRIKAPKQMGKTSLLERITDFATNQEYKTVRLTIQQAVLTNLDQFLRWFCASVSNMLSLDSQLTNYWDEDLGSKSSCTNYFQRYILTHINCPLVLALDEVDLVFEYPEIATHFLGMLRSWHEDARNMEIWQKLRLVVVHSTEVYIRLPHNQSPFNVGIPIKLLEFNCEEVQDLAQRHGLNWTRNEAEQLTSMVGGHPLLIRRALYHLQCQDTTLKELLQNAPTQTGIYGDYLRRHFNYLQQHPPLASAMKTVLNALTPISLEPILAYKLQGLGLVRLEGNNCTPSCSLYRLYFRDLL